MVGLMKSMRARVEVPYLLETRLTTKLTFRFVLDSPLVYHGEQEI